MSKCMSFLTPGETCRENLDKFEGTRSYSPDRPDGEDDSTFENPWSFDDDSATEFSVKSPFDKLAFVTKARLMTTNILSVKFKRLPVGEITERYIENNEGKPKVNDFP